MADLGACRLGEETHSRDGLWGADRAVASLADVHLRGTVCSRRAAHALRVLSGDARCGGPTPAPPSRRAERLPRSPRLRRIGRTLGARIPRSERTSPPRGARGIQPAMRTMKKGPDLRPPSPGLLAGANRTSRANLPSSGTRTPPGGAGGDGRARRGRSGGRTSRGVTGAETRCGPMQPGREPLCPRRKPAKGQHEPEH